MRARPERRGADRLGLLFFVLVVFLQPGAATIPTTVVMFLLARRFGALADS
jgi:hypothetical protein